MPPPCWSYSSPRLAASSSTSTYRRRRRPFPSASTEGRSSPTADRGERNNRPRPHRCCSAASKTCPGGSGRCPVAPPAAPGAGRRRRPRGAAAARRSPGGRGCRPGVLFPSAALAGAGPGTHRHRRGTRAGREAHLRLRLRPDGRTASGAGIYPVDGQAEVPLAFPANEVPDPIPQAKGRAAGYPITVTFPARSRIRAGYRTAPRWRRQGGGGLVLQPGETRQPGLPQQPGHDPVPDRPRRSAAGHHLHGQDDCGGRRRRLGTHLALHDHHLAAADGGHDRPGAGSPQRPAAPAGLAPLVLDAKLTKACQAHAAYLALNADRPDRPDFNSNDEDPKLPGFTREGKKAAADVQVFSAPANPAAMVDSWLASFQGRLVVLDFDAEAVGLGCARGPGKWHAVVLPKLPEFSRRREPLLYPADKQKDVPTYYDGGETPDPIPESKDHLAGFPVTATFPEKVAVTDVRAELSRSGTAVPFWPSTPQKPVARDAQRNTVCLIARQPLHEDSIYTVRLRAKVNRKPWERVWTFRTERGGPEDQREMVLATLTRVNVHRRRAGLAPVVLDSGLSPACQAHARYLLLNSNDPLTHGLGMHEEDPKLPGYTAEGQRTGKRSVVASGMPPPSAVDDWMATFYHRIPFLERRLRARRHRLRPGRTAGLVYGHRRQCRRRP